MKRIRKKYSNGEVTIVWDPGLCTIATYCFTGLPEVFAPQKRPWINPYGATTQKIIDQVNKCPSGALSYYMNDKRKEEPEEKTENTPEDENNFFRI